jgi:hypothetical protein
MQLSGAAGLATSGVRCGIKFTSTPGSVVACTVSLAQEPRAPPLRPERFPASLSGLVAAGPEGHNGLGRFVSGLEAAVIWMSGFKAFRFGTSSFELTRESVLAAARTAESLGPAASCAPRS